MKKNVIRKLLITLLMMIVGRVMLTGCGDSADAGDTLTEDVAVEEFQDTASDSSGDAASGDWNDINEQPEIDISLWAAREEWT